MRAFAYGTKRTIECPLSRVKRTWPLGVVSSGYDPKRTYRGPALPMTGVRAVLHLERAVPDYEEFIGAKKHLVLGLSSHTGPPQGSNSFAIG